MKVKAAIQLEEKEKGIVIAIIQQFIPNHKVYVFGSRVRQMAKEYSDLDLCLEGEVLTIAQMAELKEAFSESDLTISVDIIQKTEISAAFMQAIQQDLTPLLTAL